MLPRVWRPRQVVKLSNRQPAFPFAAHSLAYMRLTNHTSDVCSSWNCVAYSFIASERLKIPFWPRPVKRPSNKHFPTNHLFSLTLHTVVKGDTISISLSLSWFMTCCIHFRSHHSRSSFTAQCRTEVRHPQSSAGHSISRTDIPQVFRTKHVPKLPAVGICPSSSSRPSTTLVLLLRPAR